MEPVEVFCRLRPAAPPGSQECVGQVDDRTVRLEPPESVRAKSKTATSTESQFTAVLGPDVGQRDVFSRVSQVYPLLCSESVWGVLGILGEPV